MSNVINYKSLTIEINNKIAHIKLNRPDEFNSMNLDFWHDFPKAIHDINNDNAARVIVISSTGKHFCAGMDLSTDGNVFGFDESLQPTIKDVERQLEGPDLIDGIRDAGGTMALAIYDCKKPVIAAINGAAVGVGATMTCAMDIRLASEKARIGFVFNKIGIVPEACSSWFLPRIVGVSQALEWSYTGDIIDAEEARSSGFVKAVYPPDQLLEEAYKIDRKIVAHSPVAIALTRQMMYRNSAQSHPVEAHKVDSLAMFYVSLQDGKEGVKSFLEKRAPEFTSKASGMPEFYPWW